MPSSLFASDYSLSSHNTPTSSSPASVAGSGSSNSVHSKDRSPSVQTTQSNFTNVPPSPAGGRKDIQDLNVADLTINGGLSEKPRLAPPLSPIVSSGYPTPETGRSRRGSPDEIKSLKLGLKKGVQSEFAGFHSSSKMSSPNGHSSGANGSSNGARRPSQAEKRSSGYKTFEACMEGGLGHETKAGTYKVGTEKAYHHFNRALDCFTDALGYKPNNPRAMLARGKILITLSTTYQPPRVALNSLEDSTKLLRKLVDIAPTSVSAREALAQSCALLSGMLVDIDDSVAAADVRTTWEGTVGTLAREALRLLEDVAGDKMDKMRGMQQSEAAENAPSMAETFLALATAAITVSNLAPDLTTVDSHIELAEQALDQASNMATAAAAAKVKSSSSSANLITRVQLASGKSSLDRLRHTFMLGVELDEDDFRSLLTDMSLLATECRERAAKLKGSKAAAASSLAWESVKQLGDARVLYASLLRLVWRKRRPASLASRKASVDSRKLSNKSQTTHRNGSVDVTIKEEDEDEKAVSPIDSKDDVLGGVPVLGKNDAYQQSQASPVSNGRLDHVEPKSAVNAIRQSHGLVDIPGRKDSRASRKGSNLDAMPEGQAVSAFTREVVPRHSISSRRGSWLPENGVNTTAKNRTRRMSSMTAPLVGSDGVTAWNRKASVIALSENGDDATAVTSAELAQTAYLLLDGATTQYKLALTLLSTADLPSVHLAKAKSETLSAIASSALFMASLSRRVPAAAEKKTSLLVTAEVYSTWAAREVGWSFLIEGTKEALAADRRTNSWKADEVGKTAVMLLIRTWWFRAVTTDSVDVDTKISAKDAVEVVVRRMKDKEGVNDGDLLRMKSNLIKIEGQLDQAEELFWRSVSRILRGGNGFVMG